MGYKNLGEIKEWEGFSVGEDWGTQRAVFKAGRSKGLGDVRIHSHSWHC